MLKKFILRLLERRHYWRTVGFSELAELYANRLLRLMAINMLSGFIGVYLYQLGYPVWEIVLIFAAYFAIKALVSIPSAYFIAWVGPKHATLISNILYIPGLIALTQVSGSGWAALGVWIVLQPLAVSLYDISYHTGFSKAKHHERAGKEISFMYIAERVGAGLSPLIGGFIAYIWDPTVTMWVACAVFIISAGPLFLSPELIVTRQKIIYRGFNWRKARRGLVAILGTGADQASSASIWSLFIALAVFGTSSNVVYAEVGGLATIAVIASLVFSSLYGVLIDRHQGGALLKVSAIGNALLHLARPFISTPVGAVLVNVANEAVTSGYTMPFLKGQYDMADDLPGYRIVYMSLMQCMVGLGSALFCAVGALIVFMTDGLHGLQLCYVVAALMSLLVLRHGFPALRHSRF